MECADPAGATGLGSQTGESRARGHGAEVGVVGHAARGGGIVMALTCDSLRYLTWVLRKRFGRTVGADEILEALDSEF